MALDNTQVVVPGTGYVYLGIADDGAGTPTAKPTGSFDPLAPGTGWNSIGHTSLENGIEFGRDGDDPETLGSWQNPKLRTTNPDVTYTLSLAALQASKETYELYFGAGEGATVNGVFKIPAKPQAQSRALLIVIVDGEQMLPLYFPNVSLLGSDAIAMDPAALLEFPIKGTILSGATSGALGDIDAFVAPGPAAG
ncbi:major tail protein [Streptomyces phage Sycamore]|uniref:Major tail protein n=1 Tax=Streptomyces phage Sycamore TaxID=2767589 RepID=A0A873WDT7_9CAUD|nr:major tail protein [Streptomyces phage Sycamore]